MASKDVLESVYEKITNEEDARACKAIDESACKEVPGNFIKLIIAQFFTNLGDAMINPKITLPWILNSIGAPVYLLSWLVPIRESGSLLPQLAIASFIRKLPLRKWVWIVGSILQSISVVLIGLIAMTMQGAVAGWLVIACLVVFSLARGLSSVASKDVLGKTIPKTQRGQVTGWSASVAGLVTVGIAIVMLLSALTSFEGNAYVYGVCLMGAAIFWLLGALVYSRVVEFSGEVDGGKNGFKEALKQLSLLKTDKAFRQFVITRSLFLCTALSAPFYVVLAQHTLGNNMWVLAMFIGASGLASLVSAPFWGKFSDRSSRKVMMAACLFSSLIGLVLFVVSWLVPSLLDSVLLLPVLYFLVTIAHQGVRVGRKTYLVNLADGNKRTSYVAVSNTMIGFILLLMSFIGALTQFISLEGLILVFSGMAIVGVLMALRLPEV
ncbi:MFS transporter [Marinomonas spartinae]|uniref:MFS transporter n=1 Tax=Marinomonas spartinae TaxID=1792290 RepID=UPI0018F141B8|nr:MFS transporter [Marinomonas spartinae]MBJ7556094.1 MFS transporter [Marinomonas spartinae]